MDEVTRHIETELLLKHNILKKSNCNENVEMDDQQNGKI